MATVKELKKWLDRFPDDTIVEVGMQETHSRFESYGAVLFESPELKDSDIGVGWAFVDFRSNPFIKPHDARYGKCYLQFGESA